MKTNKNRIAARRRVAAKGKIQSSFSKLSLELILGLYFKTLNFEEKNCVLILKKLRQGIKCPAQY